MDIRTVEHIGDVVCATCVHFKAEQCWHPKRVRYDGIRVMRPETTAEDYCAEWVNRDEDNDAERL